MAITYLAYLPILPRMWVSQGLRPINRYKVPGWKPFAIVLSLISIGLSECFTPAVVRAESNVVKPGTLTPDTVPIDTPLSFLVQVLAINWLHCPSRTADWKSMAKSNPSLSVNRETITTVWLGSARSTLEIADLWALVNRRGATAARSLRRSVWSTKLLSSRFLDSLLKRAASLIALPASRRALPASVFSDAVMESWTTRSFFSSSKALSPTHNSPLTPPVISTPPINVEACLRDWRNTARHFHSMNSGTYSMTSPTTTTAVQKSSHPLRLSSDPSSASLAATSLGSIERYHRTRLRSMVITAIVVLLLVVLRLLRLFTKR